VFNHPGGPRLEGARASSAVSAAFPASVRKKGNGKARTTPLRRLVARRTFAVILLALVCVSLTVHGAPTQQGPAIPRVRAEDPRLSVAIVQGATRSATFRRLIEAIDATDGLVYVLEGTCGQGVRACLHMSLELSGKNRLLRILVNPRRAPGCELIGSIGHELQHALEALSNPNVRTSFGLSSFFHRIGPEGPRRFETPEAIQVGLAVEKEAC
jgi:hypothetical protein